MLWHMGIGIILGVVICAVAMNRFMIVRYKMGGTFAEVNQAIKDVVPTFEGWGFPFDQWEFFKSQKSKGLYFKNITNDIMHFVCKPTHANKIIDIYPHMGGIMPCTWSVYEDKHGNVFLAKMNIALMRYMFPGQIGKIMSDVAQTEKNMIAQIRRKLAA